VLAACILLAACGSKTTLFQNRTVTVGLQPQGEATAGYPIIATKNTTRIAGVDPVADAAQVALAVYPSSGAGTHPPVVALAPTNDWEAAVASSVLAAPPIHAPILLSDTAALPPVTAQALNTMAPKGSGASGGAQVIRIGDVAKTPGNRTAVIRGGGPFALAAAIDRFVSAAAGTASPDVVIASADQPQYAMPAAGWAAESGNPVLFVTASGVPGPTKQALLAHKSPHIYVLGPPSVIPDSTLHELARFGQVKRIAGPDAAATSVAFAKYRDPACTFGQPCAHVPGSFGWAIESPGHGYVLESSSRPLDAAAAAPLSSSGSYGPALVISDATRLPAPVLNYFLNYATPGYSKEGPTAAVYNHGWVIGDRSAISLGVQAQLDELLEVVPQK
jgi:hypothetical protein